MPGGFVDHLGTGARRARRAHELVGIGHLKGGDLDRHGAVSPEVAIALADGVRGRLGTDLGVGITGIAGPGGGTDEKPVGTVCFAVSGDSGSLERNIQLPGSRADVRDRSTTVALHMVRQFLPDSADPA